MKSSTAIRLVAIIAVFAVLPAYWTLFPPREDISLANGIYRNPCCKPVILKDGKMSSSNQSFDYVVEYDKGGRYVLTQHLVSVADKGKLEIDNSAFPLKIRIVGDKPPKSLEISGIEKTYHFVRQ
jgi:hypothetical protein